MSTNNAQPFKRDHGVLLKKEVGPIYRGCDFIIRPIDPIGKNLASKFLMQVEVSQHPHGWIIVACILVP